MTEPLQLYYYPGVCSLAPHIALREAGARFEPVRVDLRTRKTEAGDDFARINPKGYVPALRLPDGYVLTETAVLLQYIADTWPEAGLAPRHGGLERVRFDERLTFIGTELHKGFAPFTIMPGAGEEAKRWASQRLAARVELLARDLGERQFFHGESFTVLDAYAFFALRTYHKVLAAELPPNLAAFLARVAERPATVAAFAAEGIKA
ncbi:glutathione S-transferase [Nannocystis exedens]|uniref:Glutathione S-transferase n=1 Tax=Nannocystis exedens TaxID=54 RepID=A0A1I2FU49_9BACT|nr:glutathione S-transferase N-terminal domain-containing protein [Nannocystis exedens]PCC73701.1 glutathione S-transferase [Nannocystis exedens]SFF08348.1 glutathione S-transferase [Nannocystis exedens]